MRPALPLQDLTIGGLLRRTTSQYPDNLALMLGERTWTYSQLDEAVDVAARRLLACGIKPGEHVGLWADTEPNLIIVYYALARIGAVTCFINTCLTPSDLCKIVSRSDIEHLLIGRGYKEEGFANAVRSLADAGELAGVRSIHYISELDDSCGIARLDAVEPAAVEDLRAAEDAVDSHDTAQILYTSGTTAFPKAVMGSHYSRVNCGIAQAADMAATAEDHFCVILPLFHCFSLSVNVTAACAVGGALVLPKTRHTVDILEAIEVGKCTVMSGTPAILRAIIRSAR